MESTLTTRDTQHTSLETVPVTPERWPDLEQLFGPRGATGGGWCMWWRVTSAQYRAKQGEGNRLAHKAIVEAGETPGLLAYVDGRAIGWCAVAPREAYPRLERPRILKRVDQEPVWSVVCFFVHKAHRRKGVTVALLRAALGYARSKGVRIVEGDPVDSRAGSTADVFAYTGTLSAFRKAGFTEVERRSDTRPIMRRMVDATKGVRAAALGLKAHAQAQNDRSPLRRTLGKL